MGKRRKLDASATYVGLSGKLGEALEEHARERCIHFFSFVVIYKALIDYLQANGIAGRVTHDSGFKKIATVQVDSGHKRKAPITINTAHGPQTFTLEDFDKTDANIVNKSATEFKDIDAAHFCNLGIADELYNRKHSLAARHPVATTLLEWLEVYAGNTRNLPKRVNIGPDRIIDNFHGDYCHKILTNIARIYAKHMQHGGGFDFSTAATRRIISREAINEYLRRADKVMKRYRDNEHALGNHGLSACADAYRKVYADPKFPNDAYATLSERTKLDFQFLKIDPKDYIF